MTNEVIFDEKCPKCGKDSLMVYKGFMGNIKNCTECGYIG